MLEKRGRLIGRRSNKSLDTSALNANAVSLNSETRDEKFKPNLSSTPSMLPSGPPSKDAMAPDEILDNPPVSSFRILSIRFSPPEMRSLVVDS